MHNQQNYPASSKQLSTIVTIGSVVLIVGVLRWGREVLMPIALAVLLSFVLSPIVNLLRRNGVGPKISVALTVALAFFLIGGIGTLITGELRGLANELPAYQQNIRKRVSDLQLAVKTGSLGKVHHTVQEVVNELNKSDPPETKSTPPIPVVVKAAGGTFDPALFRPLFGPAIMAGLVIVLVIFMLLRRDDLRDRVLKMAGENRFAVASRALAEAGKQVSRYLLRQFLVNLGFGVCVGVGLWAIGLPYSLLWGFIAGVTRFIPYVGPVLGVVSPVLMSLAVFDSWTPLLLVVGLFVCLEILTSMLLEPLIYGEGIGVSEVALLIMIAFWSWLWGAAGLVLAAPLTVCLMVISKSVPSLRFIELLLTRKSALEIHRVFYHRLIAKEKNEALDLVETFRKDHSKLELFEQLLMPTLIACRGDQQRNNLPDEDWQFILQLIRDIIENAPMPNATDGDPESLKVFEESQAERPLTLGIPANDEADELTLLMLAELLADEHGRMHVLSAKISRARMLVEVQQFRPAAICVGCLPQRPTLPVRQLCQRLRSRFPTLPLVLGWWSNGNHGRARRRFAGLALDFGWTLAAVREQMVRRQRLEVSADRPATEEWGATEAAPFFDSQWVGPEKVEIKFVEQKL